MTFDPIEMSTLCNDFSISHIRRITSQIFSQTPKGLVHKPPIVVLFGKPHRTKWRRTDGTPFDLVLGHRLVILMVHATSLDRWVNSEGLTLCSTIVRRLLRNELETL